MRRRPAYAAAFAVALFVVSQFFALVHEAESRHVICPEHGEQLEASSVGQDDRCGQAHLVAVEGDGDGDEQHHDCAIARLLRTSVRTSETLRLQFTVAAVASIEVPPPLSSLASFDVILIAPKTSPPV